MNLRQAAMIGLKGLLGDANGWFCFIILGVAVLLGVKHVISDVAFSALFTAIPLLYCYTAHKVDISEIENRAPAPPPPPAKGQL
jgi:hypothetical protein